MAFGERDGERHKVVTVDGSCILKNGCIQGGQATIERKARRWGPGLPFGGGGRQEW